jgi:preprotein translocase subunit SecD
MNPKINKIFRNWRVITLISVLIIVFLILRPNPFAEGVAIKAVTKNSSAANAGFENPKQNIMPIMRERITEINQQPITTLQEYHDIVSAAQPGQSIQITTNKDTYRVDIKERKITIILNETEEVNIEQTITENQTINGTTTQTNKTINTTIQKPKTRTETLGAEDIGLVVEQAPTSNLRKGLDLQGGTRVVLKPAEQISPDMMEALLENIAQRLNVYGLSDVVVAPVRETLIGEGSTLILVELAGVSQEEIRDLLARQGKFEATIANKTVFKGGGDITYVCRTAQCSGIDPNTGCGTTPGGYACGFFFTINLKPDAAQRQAELTRNLALAPTDPKYLAEPLILYLDNQEVDKLNIATDLRGKPTTEIAISGSGTGTTQQEAITNTLQNMKKLQTILITGNLPAKLDIVRLDTISPVLGATFLNKAFIMGLLAVIGVTILLTLFYRRITLAIPIILTSMSEIFITLGIAAFIGWNIDLAAIAGLIAAVGTGVNDQIIITDETLRKEAADQHISWKDRIKQAFGVIFSAYFTILVAMIPLYFAGAGLLKGFAITTILGVTAGVFITRPAYAAIMQIIFEE